jgi:hypothetical protein
VEVDARLVKLNMKQHISSLRYLIESNSGLLDSLFSKEVLTREHVAEIATSLYNKNDKMLDFLINRHAGDCTKVLEALVATGQLHVAHFINPHGGKFLSCTSCMCSVNFLH